MVHTSQKHVLSEIPGELQGTDLVLVDPASRAADQIGRWFSWQGSSIYVVATRVANCHFVSVTLGDAKNIGRGGKLQILQNLD